MRKHSHGTPAPRFLLFALLVAVMGIWPAAVAAQGQGLEARVSALETRATAVEGRAAALEQLAATQGQLLTSLQSQLTAQSQQLTLLSQRVNSLAPLNFTVDCAAGQTVGAALSQAGSRPALVTITVKGVCTENVNVNRSNTILRGDADGAGLASPAVGSGVLSVNAQDVVIDGLTLQGAVFVGTGSRVRFSNTHVKGSNFHGVPIFSAFVEFASSSVEGSASVGIQAMSGSTVRLHDTWIHDNSFGLDIADGSFALLGGGSRFTNNGEGVAAGFGSMVHFERAYVEDNGNTGVSVTAGSVVHFGFAGGTTFIRANGSHGIMLRDTSLATSLFQGGSAEITGNAGWGVTCSGPPAVAQLVGNIGTVSGNTMGQISCPISW